MQRSQAADVRRELCEAAARQAQRAQLCRRRLEGRQRPHGAAAQIQQPQVCGRGHMVSKPTGRSRDALRQKLSACQSKPAENLVMNDAPHDSPVLKTIASVQHECRSSTGT